MKVMALKMGWDGLKRRRAGEVFEWTGPVKDGKPAALWVKMVGDDAAETQKLGRGEGERALSEVSKDNKHRADLMKKLNDAGVVFFKGSPIEHLESLAALVDQLTEAGKEIPPGSNFNALKLLLEADEHEGAE